MAATVRSHPIWAAWYDRINLKSESTWLGESRRLVLAHARGRVLDIGTGTGQNLLHYSDVDQVVASEPDPAFRRQLSRRLPDAKVPVEVLDAPAERLPFADATFDTVVATLVMCSVDDPKQAAAELRRVVRPNGVLLVVEHVRTDGGFREIAQDAIVPIWGLLVGGCHPNRPSVQTLSEAGFHMTELRRFVPSGVPPVTRPFVVAMGRPTLTPSAVHP